ncbi:MAG: amidase family protein [Gammaproteobacteria bacterium]|nr:amidase family protein [Gammaproteobacteria bacterium]
MTDTETTPAWQWLATEVAASVRQGEISATEVTRQALTRLQDVNPTLNAVVQVTEQDALQAAERVDAAVRDGRDPGPMAGVPVTVKVNIDQQGYPNTNGLRLQQDKLAMADHPVVTAFREAGAIIIGRTNTPAFSLRWFCRNSLHGETLNPVNSELTPGGSSGGAASATAAGIGAIGHGTDIAGSIRYPAYACGIHGLRPSLGRVAAWNPSSADRFIAGQLMAVSGPLARSIDDVELSLRTMARADHRDPWHVPVPFEQPPYQRKVALCMTPEDWQVDEQVKATVENAAQELQRAGWQVEEVDCPSIRDAASMNLMLWMAEMESAGVELVEKENDPDANLVFARLCAKTTSPDAAQLQGVMQERAALIRQWQAFLSEYPVMLGPVSGQLPFDNHADVADDTSFDRVFDAQLMQIGLPLLGLPGLTVSTGSVNNRPTGVQLVANRFREDVLLDVGRDLEAVYGIRPVATAQT